MTTVYVSTFHQCYFLVIDISKQYLTCPPCISVISVRYFRETPPTFRKVDTICILILLMNNSMYWLCKLCIKQRVRVAKSLFFFSLILSYFFVIVVEIVNHILWKFHVYVFIEHYEPVAGLTLVVADIQ